MQLPEVGYLMVVRDARGTLWTVAAASGGMVDFIEGRGG